MRRVLAASAALAVAASLSTLPSSQARGPAAQAAPVTQISAPRQGEGWGITWSKAPFEFFTRGASGAVNYDVRVSRTSMRSAKRAAWHRPPYLQGTRRARLWLPISPGEAVCVSARARDAAGNVEPWRADNYTCLVRVLGARKLERRGRIAVLRDPGYYSGAAIVMHPGSSATLYGVPKGAMPEVVYTDWRNRRLYWYYPDDEIASGATWRASRTASRTASQRPNRHWLLQTNTFPRRGPLRFGTALGGSATEPLQGVAIYPSWARR